MRTPFPPRLALLAAALLATPPVPAVPAADVVVLRGAGATFPYPLYREWFKAYAAAAATLPADFRASLVDAPGRDSYGICGFTWILVYRDQADEARGKALVSFLRWALTEGQRMNTSLDYAPVPGPLFRKVEAALGTIRVRGKPPR